MTSFPWKYFILLVALHCSCADKESAIPVSEGEGTQCDADLDTAETCLACSRLPQEIAVKLTDCCTEDKARTFCEICTKNSLECLKEAFSVQEANADDESQSVETDGFRKRFGTLFMGPGRIGKRYGRLFLGRSRGGSYIYGKRGAQYGRPGFKRSFDADFRRDRYGDLNTAGNLFKSIGSADKRDFYENSWDGDYNKDWVDQRAKDKRYGRLFLSGKRYGTLFMGR